MKKVAATSGHSRSLDEDFFFVGSGRGAAAGNSWLQRAGVVANFYGFLLGLSHEMQLQAQNTHISKAVEKFLRKKTGEGAGGTMNIRARGIYRRDAKGAEKFAR
ncbi:MAG TPA: hypothetical protein VKR26_07270 [Terriglobales bacterium]|jgi:hypothetical protein|nr:hypothetical protein [Terriglobales bacterium]